MKIVIGNDHSAVELKNIIKAHLEEKGYEVMNVGTDTSDLSGCQQGKGDPGLRVQRALYCKAFQNAQ